ncbi:hypothetical protein FHX80_112174 [Streptomyces brevispora]|uniref:Uncharacterized protein n=1 Tax=Streptomyces brevispora TaxID=887462 RepID=A0A561UWJ5_9ACTN|nr:hypothetical protein FHX80_112174 [Streptomyces brevispora]
MSSRIHICPRQGVCPQFTHRPTLPCVAAPTPLDIEWPPHQWETIFGHLGSDLQPLLSRLVRVTREHPTAATVSELAQEEFTRSRPIWLIGRDLGVSWVRDRPGRARVRPDRGPFQGGFTRPSSLRRLPGDVSPASARSEAGPSRAARTLVPAAPFRLPVGAGGLGPVRRLMPGAEPYRAWALPVHRGLRPGQRVRPADRGARWPVSAGAEGTPGAGGESRGHLAVPRRPGADAEEPVAPHRSQGEGTQGPAGACRPGHEGGSQAHPVHQARGVSA